MHILAFGTYDVTSHPRVGVLIQGFRDQGHQVSEINLPLGLDTAERIALVRQPWRLPALALRLLNRWSRLARAGIRARRRARFDAVLVGYLGHFDVHLARALFAGTPILLDHLVSASGTVRDRRLAGTRGARAWLMRLIDSSALRAADVVIVDTAQRAAALPPAARKRSAVCAVGATREWFEAGAKTQPREQRRPLRAIFVGLYTPLHGTPVVAEALALLAADDRIQITMVGDGQDRPQAEQLAADNHFVTWLDWVPYDQLPAFVAEHDVTLGIFGTGPKALEVVPTKVFQGAAAGTVILTSDTAPQRDALEAAAVYVAAGEPRELAEALQWLADDPAAVTRLRGAAFDRACTCFSAGEVVAPALAALESLDR